MKATKQFIEDAREGGWHFHTNHELMDLVNIFAHDILLDPLAWQAVGKVRGWKKAGVFKGNFISKHWEKIAESNYKQHTFIDHLADNLTIDEALEKIL